MKPPSPFAQQQRQKDAHPPLALTDWFHAPECDQAVRRHQVWSLLAWYHHEIIVPHRGIRGALRRMGWRIQARLHPNETGRHRARVALLSTWERIALRVQLAQAKAMQETEAAHRNGTG